MSNQPGAAYPNVSRVELERLLAVNSRDPHALLGAHPVAGGVAVRAFRPEAENIRSARALIELGRELGLEANLERGQEIIYQALRAGVVLSAEARDFALALGLAPAALEQTEQTVLVKG